MPPQRQRADKQKAKEKKEKIILIGLVAALVVVGAIELPSMLKGSSSGGASSVAQTTSSSSTVSTSPIGTSASGTAAPGSLPNASGYKAGAGQLSGFSLFKGNVDPFGIATTSAGTTSAGTTSGTTTMSSKTKTTKTSSTTTTKQGSYVAARISTNGTSEDVALDKTFPAASPVFVLDSVSAKKIEISIAGGSFSNGRAKLAIAKGKSVTLVNTVDSTRYTIKFIIPLTSSMFTATTGTTTTGTTATTGTTTTGTATTGTTTTG
jgi:hypothetical protein